MANRAYAFNDIAILKVNSVPVLDYFVKVKEQLATADYIYCKMENVKHQTTLASHHSNIALAKSQIIH